MVKYFHFTQKNLGTFNYTFLFNHYDNVQKLKNFAQNFSFSQISHLRGNTGGHYGMPTLFLTLPFTKNEQVLISD